MGFLKRIAKRIVRAVVVIVKAVVRLAVRIVSTFAGLVLGVFDLLVGFLTWPEKKLRIQIFILSDHTGPVLTNQAHLTSAIDYARILLKDHFNVKLLPYSKNFVEIIKIPAPEAALNVGCGVGAFGDEFWEAGDYFAKHLAGWNAAPVSGTFPVTVFVVSSITGAGGCSMGPLTDYVTISLDSLSFGPTGLVHEIGHACNLLLHSLGKSNFMYRSPAGRGHGVKWFQKNLFRSSRHVLYW